jgi:hypothetical protein
MSVLTMNAARPPAVAGPLGAEHLQTIAMARRQGRKISRAAGVATFSGWTTAIFAALALLGGLFSMPALVLGLGLATAAYVELNGARALRRLNLAAPRRLGCNQVGLFVILSAYAGWCIVAALLGPQPYAEYVAAGGELADTLEPIARLHTAVTVSFYGAVILCSLIAQGFAAVYYFTRSRHLRVYLANTPTWVVDMLRVAEA